MTQTYFYKIANYLPLQEEIWSCYEQTWNSFTEGWFAPSLVEIGFVVLQIEHLKMWKVYDVNDADDADRQRKVLIRIDKKVS